RIFDKMVKLAERGDAIDLVTLKEELSRSGELEEVGGPAYIAALTDGVPRSANVEHYARIVKGTSRDRQVEMALTAAIGLVRTAGAEAALERLSVSLGDESAPTALRIQTALDLIQA